MYVTFSRLKIPNWKLYKDTIKQNLCDNPTNLDIEINQIQINLIIDHLCNLKPITRLLAELIQKWNKKCNDVIKTYKKHLTDSKNQNR